METRKFGRTDLQVSRLGFGGIPIQRVDQQEATRIVHACLDQGVNFFDTARGYGDSEEKLGQALLGRRHQAIIASKSPKRDAIGFREDLETCLKTMTIDYVDLYQLHMVSAPEVWEQVRSENGALKALLRAREEGLVRYIGVSSHSNDILLQMIETEIFDSVQLPLNAVEKQFYPSLAKAKELNIGSIAMKSLAGGSFLRSDLALRYAAESAVDVLIPGMDKAEQVADNVAAIMAGPLSEEERAIIEAEAASLGDNFCRRCDYCQPCPEKVPIASVFILEGYVRRYGLAEWAKTRYASLPQDASHCSECGLCESRCPYDLKIRDKLKGAHGVLEQRDGN